MSTDLKAQLCCRGVLAVEAHPALYRGCVVLVGSSTGGVTMLEGTLAQEPKPVGSTYQLGSSAQVSEARGGRTVESRPDSKQMAAADLLMRQHAGGHAQACGLHLATGLQCTGEGD